MQLFLAAKVNWRMMTQQLGLLPWRCLSPLGFQWLREELTSLHCQTYAEWKKILSALKTHSHEWLRYKGQAAVGFSAPSRALKSSGIPQLSVWNLEWFSKALSNYAAMFPETGNKWNHMTCARFNTLHFPTRDTYCTF